MRRLTQTKFAIVMVIALVAAVTVGVGDAAAQSADGCPDGPNCTEASNFDSSIESWISDNVSTVWLENKTLGIDFAGGVLHLYDIRSGVGECHYLNCTQGRSTLFTPGVYKTFYLQPGHYRLRFRAGQDTALILNDWVVNVQSSDNFWTFSGELSAWWYTTVATGSFTVNSPSSVRIQVATHANSYFDYIWVEKLAETEATPTSVYWTVTPGGPTLTPTRTPIPYNQQATPAPVGTAVCQAGSPPATPEIPAYATPITGTLSRLETFEMASDVLADWKSVGEIRHAAGADHTGDGGASISLHYEPHWGSTSETAFSHALIYEINFGIPVWINAWAQADVVPVGETAALEIWQLIGGNWDLAVSANASAGSWYPAHAAISENATAIAFVGARSDQPSDGYMLLDDVYLYAPESNTPYCNGQYPNDVTTIDGQTRTYGLGNSVSSLTYPAGKDCPGGIMQPNNLWGMLLAQLTLMLDAQMANAPAHVLGSTRDLAQQFMLGPVGGLVVLATIVFDWRVPVIMLEAYMAFQAGLTLIGIWKTIRRAFIV